MENPYRFGLNFSLHNWYSLSIFWLDQCFATKKSDQKKTTRRPCVRCDRRRPVLTLQTSITYCLWFTNPVVVEVVVYRIIYRVLAPSQVVGLPRWLALGFLNHQPYCGLIWPKKSNNMYFVLGGSFFSAIYYLLVDCFFVISANTITRE